MRGYRVNTSYALSDVFDDGEPAGIDLRSALFVYACYGIAAEPGLSFDDLAQFMRNVDSEQRTQLGIPITVLGADEGNT
jgi:hypothetical protein